MTIRFTAKYTRTSLCRKRDPTVHDFAKQVPGSLQDLKQARKKHYCNYIKYVTGDTETSVVVVTNKPLFTHLLYVKKTNRTTQFTCGAESILRHQHFPSRPRNSPHFT